YLLRAPGQPVNFSGFSGTAFIIVEGNINSAKYCLERNARILPCFNQSPIKCGHLQHSPTSTAKMRLNLCKVVEIIFHVMRPNALCTAQSWRRLKLRCFTVASLVGEQMTNSLC